MNQTVSSKISFIDKYRFWLILLAAALVLEIPIISIPIKWFESYFHEISHGLAALISGGSIVQIQLFPNGAGLCTTRGGSALLISFFGYAGAVIWGVTIYWLASLHRRSAHIVSVIIAALLTTSLLFWVRDLLTLVIITVLLAIVLVKFKIKNAKYFKVLLQLIGGCVLLNSIKSPWYLVDGRSLGDGAALANITLVPEIVWISIWFLCGVTGIIVLAKAKL